MKTAPHSAYQSNRIGTYLFSYQCLRCAIILTPPLERGSIARETDSKQLRSQQKILCHDDEVGGWSDVVGALCARGYCRADGMTESRFTGLCKSYTVER